MSAHPKFKKEDNKQKWEDAEFPLVCETCLGDNPYVRMTQEKFGKKCQVCDVPFTVFAWQAGTKGRLKRVEICRSCAQAKNVCQVCIYDLQYGLPVKVRDRILAEAGSAASCMVVPQSEQNRAYFKQKQEQQLAQGQNLVGEANAMAVAKLKEMANMAPRYERNMAKLCSFFARGECNRGANCPFRHEMPRDRNDPMSNQSTKNRFYGSSDPVANKILGRHRKREAEAKKADEDGFDKARATLYLRFRGEAPYPILTEPDIRDKFYSFGEIISVRIQADKGQAFVEYTQPEATELAIASMNKQNLLERELIVKWARAPKRGDADNTKRGESRSDAPRPIKAIKPMAPAGGFSSSIALPKGLTSALKPSAQVAAIAAARRRKVNAAPQVGVPRPGGGAIRRIGATTSKSMVGSRKPYYPSADPGRLGSKTSNDN